MNLLIDLSVLIALMFSFLLIGFIIYYVFIRAVPKAHFLKKIGSTYEHVKTVKFKLKATSIKYNKKVYPINLKDATVRWKKSKPHLFYDIETLLPLSFNDISNKKDAEMFNTLTDNRILRNMFGKETEKLLIIIILVLGVALIISVAFNMYVISNPEQFINNVNSTTINTPKVSPIV